MIRKTSKGGKKREEGERVAESRSIRMEVVDSDHPTTTDIWLLALPWDRPIRKGAQTEESNGHRFTHVCCTANACITKPATLALCSAIII